MGKLREKFEHEINDATSGMYSINAISEQCEQITDDFTVAFAIFLRQKCLIDDNYLYYFFNGKKYNETELLQHFKNNIYDN
jgi:hypothetical protein